MATLDQSQREQIEEQGFVHVRDAFPSEAAAQMRDVVWSALEEQGIRRRDPSSWTVEAPSHLQRLRKAPPFREIGTARTLGAIEDLLGPVPWAVPKDWGAFFILFPAGRPWTVPSASWHVDHEWTAPLRPLRALKVHAAFGDIEPRAGGMTVVAGSHRVVARLVAESPPPPEARAAEVRHLVMQGHPYLRDLATEGDREARIARFVEAEEEVLGAALRVVELTAAAGDVILIHPLLLHTRPTNAGTNPRFLLNKDLYPPEVGH